MANNQLLKGTIIKTLFVSIELVALVVFAIITFSNDGTSPWGYWGSIAMVFAALSPIIVYVLADAVFSFFNVNIVIKKRHTVESIKKYHKISKAFFIWGIITGGLYGVVLVPIFLLENIFLFNGYKKELEKIKYIDFVTNMMWTPKDSNQV